jgi:hypothetical protein
MYRLRRCFYLSSKLGLYVGLIACFALRVTDPWTSHHAESFGQVIYYVHVYNASLLVESYCTHDAQLQYDFICAGT